MSPSTEPPPLPAGMDGWAVRKSDGTETHAVSPKDAAKLAGIAVFKIQQWIKEGTVAVTPGPHGYDLVLVDSLWAALPPELKAEDVRQSR